MTELTEALRIRLAAQLEDQYQRATERNQPPPQLPIEQWEQCQQILHQLQRAQLRGLRLVIPRLRRRWREALTALQQQCRQLSTDTPLTRTPTFRELHAELHTLQQEFPHLTLEPRRKILVVETEPITLENRDLGSFAIQLQLTGLPHAGWFETVALEPQPAASHAAVTHPHVENDQLCAGAGRDALRAALDDGRLTDFFLIVAQILRTYNPANAFVELDTWDTVPCDDCGDYCDEDELGLCEPCGKALCTGCQLNCPDCPTVCCNECLTNCDDCGQRLCEQCVRPCLGCDSLICAECRNDQFRCPHCAALAAESVDDENLISEPPPPNPPSTDAITNTAVHPVRLGQTPHTA